MPFTSHTEWDPLKTMMVADIDVTNKDIKSDIFKLEGKLLSVLVNRTKSMLDKVSNILVKKGVKVIRPDPTKFKGSHRFPVLNIRDRLGVIDNKLILFSSEESVRGMEDCIDLNILELVFCLITSAGLSDIRISSSQ